MRRASVAPAPAPAPADWPHRAEALRHEGAAQAAVSLAGLGLYGAAVLLWCAPHAHDARPRVDVGFFALALGPLAWLGGLADMAHWAVRVTAPGLALAAALTAAALLVVSADPRRGAVELAVFAGSGAVLAAALLGGWRALRRSSLPGGGRPPAYANPQPPEPVETTLWRLEATGVSAWGSGALSGPVLSATALAVLASVGLDGARGDGRWAWVAAAGAGALVAAQGGLTVLGLRDFVRRRAVGRLRWSAASGAALCGLICLAAAATALALGDRQLLGFEAVMVPIALGAAGSGWRACHLADAMLADPLFAHVPPGEVAGVSKAASRRPRAASPRLPPRADAR